MKLGKWYAASLLLCLLTACNHPKSGNRTNELKQLVAVASEAHNTDQERISAALKALPIARRKGDARSVLELSSILAVTYQKMDSSENALYYFRYMASWADSVSDKEHAAMAYNNMGFVFSDLSVYDSALFYYRKANAIFVKTANKLRTAQALINEGIIYKNTGRYDTAFQRTLDAVILLEHQDAAFELASAYTTLGNILKELNKTEDALAYFGKAMTIWQKLKDSTGIAGVWNNRGNIYKRTNDYHKALSCYKNALAIKQKAGIQKTAIILDNIAQCFLSLHQYDSAEYYIEKAFAQQSTGGDRDGYMTSANHLVRLYLSQNRLSEAEHTALRNLDLARAPIYMPQQLENTLLLVDIETQKGDYVRAVQYARQAIILKDSIFSNTVASTVPALQTQRQIKDQQQELELAKSRDALRTVQLKSRERSLIWMGCTILLLMLVIYLLYRSNRFRKKAKEYAELLMSELHHRVKNNMQIILGILFLQKTKTINTEVHQILDATGNRIKFMETLHGLLYKRTYKGNIDMGLFLEHLCGSIEQGFINEQYAPHISMTIHNVTLAIDHAIPLGMIANELLTNIYKYAQPDESLIPKINLELMCSGKNYILYIADNNLAWDMNKMQNSKGLGNSLVQTLVRQLHAKWISYRDGALTVQTITFNL